MSIRYLKKHVALEGVIGPEDAEALAHRLSQPGSHAVHLGKCEHVHAAVLQVLLVFRPTLVEPPADPWLARALSAPAG